MSISPLVDKETAALLSDLWEPFCMYLPEWGSGISNSSGFRTEIDHALTAAEKRMGFRSIPLKSVKANLRAMTAAETALLNNVISRRSLAKSLVPFFSDATYLNVPATAPTSTLSCNTALRRFSGSSRIVVINPSLDSVSASLDFEILEVASKTDTTITLSTPTTLTLAAGAVVMPLIESRPSLHTRRKILTDELSEYSLKASEHAGPTQLPATVTPGSLPPGFDTYNGLPVLKNGDMKDGVVAGNSRYGNEKKSGIGFVISAEGDFVRPEFRLRMNSRDRAEAWSFINFFDSRGGKLFPFYVICPSLNFVTTSIAETALVIDAAFPELDWAEITDVALEQPDGSFLYRGITHSVRTGGGTVDVVLFDSSITTQEAADTIAVYPLYLSRLASDEMREDWDTTELMRTTLSTVAVHQEKSVTVTNLVELTTVPVAGAFNVLQCSGACWKLTNCNDAGESIYVDLNLVSIKNKIISLIELQNKAWSISRSNPCGGTLTTPATLDTVYDSCPDLAQPNLVCIPALAMNDTFDTTPDCMMSTYGIEVGGTDGCGESGSFTTIDGKQYTWTDSAATPPGTPCGGTSCACRDENNTLTGEYASTCVITVTRVS